MEFPRVWVQSEWKILKDKEDYWLKLSSGDRKLVGLKTVYQKVGAGGENEKVLELNFFKKGAVVQLWFFGPNKEKEIRIQSRIMKDGKWIYGMPDKKVTLEALVSGDLRLRGVRVQLQVEPGKIVTVDFYKPGSEPMPGNFPD